MEASVSIAGSATGIYSSRHTLLRHSAVLAVAVSAAHPVGSIATIVRSDPHRILRAPRVLTRRRRRTKRRSLTDADDGDGIFYGDGDDGPFGGGGDGGGGASGGGGGRGWNSDGFGEYDGEEGWRWWGTSDPAFDVVCEVLGWVALSNCVVFAWKKIAREKALPPRLEQPIC